MLRSLAIATGLLMAALVGCSVDDGDIAGDSPSVAAVLAHVPSSFEVDAARLSAGFAAAEARREAQRSQQQSEDAFAAEAARVAAEAAAEQSADDCIGYGCSPEQDAELDEAERAANDDYGPGCDYQLCGDPGSGFPPFACDAGPNGLPVCEGEVPASIGPYYTPDGTLVGG
jgi:hypothetical protein